MIDWATLPLPAPTVDLNNQVESSVIRTKMDSGRVRQRKRFTRALRVVSIAWKFDDDEYAIFQGVFEYKLNQGADWFTISLPLGDGFKTFTARFSKPWTARHEPVLYWKVSAQLEIESGSALTEAELDAILDPEP